MSRNVKRKFNYTAKAVGSFVPAITRPVFEKYGFQTGALLTDWATIIGEPLSQFTAPEQIKWPGRQNQIAGAELDGDERQTSGATLVIRVEGPAALEVQHQTPQIIERINEYLGYRAITQVRILQAPLDRPLQKSAAPPVDLDKPIDNDAEIEVSDDRLNLALVRLWRGIQARKINNSSKNAQ